MHWTNQSFKTKFKQTETNQAIDVAISFSEAYIQGPNQAIDVANNDPNSWPSVAPAPMNPNNLEPDWIQPKCQMQNIKPWWF